MTELSPAASCGGSLEARVAGRTHAGQRRPENQDNFLIAEMTVGERAVVVRPETGIPRDDLRVAVREHGLLLLVADGMGGAAAGRLASGLACTFMVAELQEGWAADPDVTPQRFAARLQEAVHKTNARIHSHTQRNPDTRGMGSTLTAVGVLGEYIYVAQVGDSRAYLTRSGRTTQITRDQSLVQHMIDAGAMRPEDAERSAHANVILQALGVRPTVEVDITYQALCRDDFLLICSDGLHRVVGAAEITEVVHQLESPTLVCEHLIALANARGGPDNISVIATSFQGDGLSIARPDAIVGRTEFPFDPAV